MISVLVTPRGLIMPTGLYPVPRGSSRNHRLMSEQRVVAVNVSNPPFLGLTLSHLRRGQKALAAHCSGGSQGPGKYVAGWRPWRAGRSGHHGGQAAEGGAV